MWCTKHSIVTWFSDLFASFVCLLDAFSGMVKTDARGGVVAVNLNLIFSTDICVELSR